MAEEKKDIAAGAETTEKKAAPKKAAPKKVEGETAVKKAPVKKAAPKKEVAEATEVKKAAPKKVVAEVAEVKEAAPKKVAAEVAEVKEAAPKKEVAPEKEVAEVKKAAPKKAVAPKASSKTGYQPRFKARFEDEIRDALNKEFNYKSTMAIPRIEKIVINMGVGGAVNDKNMADAAVNDLSLLAGQKAMKTLARKSVSNFKLREGMAIGAKVTLRKIRMFDFLDKLVSIALPRVRDFRGVKATGFDGRGNFSFGVSEQIIFPEIIYDKIDKVRGMDITIVTTAKTDQEAKSLLTHFGFPFRNK